MVRRLALLTIALLTLSSCVSNAVEPVILTIQARPTPVPTPLFIPPVPLAEYADWCNTLEGNDRFTDEALSKCGCPDCDKVPEWGGLPAQCMALCR